MLRVNQMIFDLRKKVVFVFHKEEAATAGSKLYLVDFFLRAFSDLVSPIFILPTA